MIRNDRTSSVGGGVCAYINSKTKVRRIYDFENSSIESLWMSVRSNRLPRSIPVLLLAVIYHSTSRDATENCELYNHIQGNVDLFLLNHPDALVMICGDFNPVSIGFNANRIKQISGLRQISNVAMRGESNLDWWLIKMKHLDFQIIQLPPVGSSDHNSIIVKSHLHRVTNPSNDRVWKRDLRDSNIRFFGQWITNFDWSPVFEISDCDVKYNELNVIMSGMIESFFPKRQLRTRKSDKAWVTQSLKSLIKRRQRALHLYGKFSHIYKYWRNKVQQEVKTARKRFYHQSVKMLKNTNPARWWKEIKSLGGLSFQQSWYHHLLSDDNPNCVDLSESYDFLVGLTAYFEPLARCHQIEETEVPDYVTVNPGQVYPALRRIKTTKSQGPDGIPNKALKTFPFPNIIDVS
ncbi:Hypothetical predicted protein [Paramuricea clavata]|uniref:Uncharacterized protein n=1 Tax=Paramuricea clavata TaxID=317549 RepID=A0A6S7K5F6_PARCT|nr:Hypothetical predicted protein [Paramuricea clavata]